MTSLLDRHPIVSACDVLSRLGCTLFLGVCVVVMGMCLWWGMLASPLAGVLCIGCTVHDDGINRTVTYFAACTLICIGCVTYGFTIGFKRIWRAVFA